MTIAELRELCERDCGEDFAAGILADEQIAAAARTWLPALIEVVEAAKRLADDLTTVPMSFPVNDDWHALKAALARLDEAGRPLAKRRGMRR